MVIDFGHIYKRDARIEPEIVVEDINKQPFVLVSTKFYAFISACCWSPTTINVSVRSQYKNKRRSVEIYDAIEQSLRSICETRVSNEQPTAKQPLRTFTPSDNGVLLCMPGYIGNYRLAGKVFNTLACKLVTSFPSNRQLNPPKLNILGHICLFHEETGELIAIISAHEITAWQTAAASIVATKYLFSQQPSSPKIKTLAILGCGVEGRIHSIGFLATHFVDSICLWNRTKSRADSLAAELNSLRQTFKNPNIQVSCFDSVEKCVKQADVIVTATYTDTPFLFRSMIKNNVHINAVGAGEAGHHSEIAEDIYADSNTKIFVDSIQGANAEFRFNASIVIVGEVGDIINGHSSTPSGGITVFHSMGMGVEDAAVGQAILEKYQSTAK